MVLKNFIEKRGDFLNTWLESNLRKLLLCSVCMLFIFGGTALASFRIGDEGSSVTDIQTRLQKLGYEIASVDGIYGNATAVAVSKFQQDIGLEVDGIVGKETYRAMLGTDIPEPVSRGGSSMMRTLVSNAMQYRGVPYSFGGTSSYGFDCSGYTQYVFATVGIYLPRMADEQFYNTTPISTSELQRGDLVFFSTYEPGPSHVGIYLGDGQFISAKSSTGVSVGSIYDPYYWGPRYIGARRVV